jgi:hypothetical protein
MHVQTMDRDCYTLLICTITCCPTIRLFKMLRCLCKEASDIAESTNKYIAQSLATIRKAMVRRNKLDVYLRSNLNATHWRSLDDIFDSSIACAIVEGYVSVKRARCPSMSSVCECLEGLHNALEVPHNTVRFRINKAKLMRTLNSTFGSGNAANKLIYFYFDESECIRAASRELLCRRRVQFLEFERC